MIDLIGGPDSPWIAAVGRMLLHSLWQGAGIAAALGVVLGVLRRAPSSARYLAACAAMIAMVVLPATTLIRPDPSQRPPADQSGPAPARGVPSDPMSTAPRPDTPGPRTIDPLRPILPTIVGLWLAGVGVFSLRLLGGWTRARRWATRRTRPLAGPWPGRVDRIKERLRLRRAVALLESAWVDVPMVVGWIRPAVLVPVAAFSGLSAPELEAILAHELAHIRRHDYAVNLIQCVVEVLLFYHPAAWWISRVIRYEREACCDDLAVAACGDRLTYARALAAMEGLRVPAFSPSPAASGGVLLARVRRILDPQEASMNPVRLLAVPAVILALTPLWFARAGDDRPARDDPPGGPSLPKNEIFANIIAGLEEAATGRFLLGPDGSPAGRSTRAGGVSGKLPEGPIAEVRLEGNATIPPEKIKARLLSMAGQPFDAGKIDADVRSLMRTHWFSQVEAYYDESPPGSGKSALIFSVREMPVLTHVEFRGRKAIRLKEIEDTTGLKKGNRADYMRTRNAVHSIYRLYKEKGYDLAEVELIEGGNPGDTKVVMQIFEGAKVKVSSIDFVGCQFASAAMLQTHITTRKPILGLFGRYQEGMLDEDKQKLVDYYQGQGFFEAKVTPVTRAGEKPGEIHLTFVISEGPRYIVRKVIIEGNSKIKTEQLMADMQLHSNKPYLLTVREADKNRILIQYNAIGCIDTEVAVEPRFTSERGVVDLLYKISEGEPYLLGELEIAGNDRTKDKVIRREATQAGLLPGEILDKNRLEIYKRRLTMLGYFQNDPEKRDKQIKVEIRRRRPPDQPYGDLMIPRLDQAEQARMQDPAPGDGPAQAIPVPDALPMQPRPPAGGGGGGGGGGLLPGLPGLGENPFSPPADSPPQDVLPPIEVPTPPPGNQPVGPGGRPVGPPGPPPGQPPVGAGEPPGSYPSIPGMGMTNVGPDRNDPFPNRSYADVVTSLEEAPTGRFMVSVGANSFQGLMGSIQIYEKNFDLLNPPKSWNDFVTSKAFRGAGQEFRIFVQAGTLINYMQVSLRDPYLFDLPIGAGVSGYLFQRLYPNWDERRGGGRVNIGRQIGTMTYVDFSAWAEEVDFFGYRTPAPADYLAASGYTQLYAIMPSLRIDNRNSPFMPTKGQYANFSVEQGFGTFIFTKFDAEARAYFPVYHRPDGTGPQFFTLRGHWGVATESTPVYERFFAGNFGSLRGFQYRSVSPHAFGVPTGGVMMAVGSVEYQFPWNARDTFNQIIFTDFGTVTPNYQLNDMRVSVGTGLKVSLPMMGPMPFEFDLAFPVMHAYGDKFQPFNFTVSGFY